MTIVWTEDRIRERARELGPWFHNMELKGVWTAPEHFLGDYPAVKWRHFAHTIPADLAGKTVLDIGCNGGFYSMEMKRRGAARVVGIDFDDDYLAQARFAADVEGLDIEFRQMSVYDVAELGERFDVVFFIGVLYHLRHPLLALDLIHEHVTRDLLVFQSMQRVARRCPRSLRTTLSPRRRCSGSRAIRSCTFIERSYSHDNTNWWTPNRACAAAMLRSAGFRIEAMPEEEVFICRHVEAPSGAAYPARGTPR